MYKSGHRLSSRSSYADAPSLMLVHRAVGLGLEDAVGADDIKLSSLLSLGGTLLSFSPTPKTPQPLSTPSLGPWRF